MEKKLTQSQMEGSLQSSVSSLSLQDTESSPASVRKAYVPPHMRNLPSPQTSLKSSQPSKSQRGSFDKKRNDKDPNDPFYHRADVSKRSLRLEATLFGSQTNSGINFDKYDDIPVDVSGNDIPEPIVDFKSSNMDELLKFNIDLANYNHPTPVQRYSISVVTAGRDLMACAQTGSGKVSFVLINFRPQHFYCLF
jgi:ATP-dependent RNA helicase DDX3X